MLYMITIFFTEESSNCFLSRHFDHALMSSAVNLTWDFSSRRQVFSPAGKTEWKTNAPCVKSCTQPAKVMSRYIFVIVHSRQFTWNELTSIKCFFSQSIHLILAGLIFNMIPFFPGDFFLNFTFLQKKKSKSRRGNCLILPHASYGPVIIHHFPCLWAPHLRYILQMLYKKVQAHRRFPSRYYAFIDLSVRMSFLLLFQSFGVCAPPNNTSEP